MPQYLVAIHHPKPCSATSTCSTKKWRLPAPGSLPAACNRPSTRNHSEKQPGGEAVITDGPYLDQGTR